MKNKTKQLGHGFVPPVIEKTDFWLGSGKLGSVVINESVARVWLCFASFCQESVRIIWFNFI